MLELFEAIDETHARHTVAYSDAKIGLRAFLVMDDVTLGPAVGGIRTQPYPSLVHALQDACWLARAMTEKCALAGLNAGGGKIVVIEQPNMNREAVFATLAERLEDLRGTFWTGPDLGTTASDLAAMHGKTKYVHFDEHGVAHSVAQGVLRGIQGCIDFDAQKKELSDLVIGILGVGRVGLEVALTLAAQGAHLRIADVDAERAQLAREKILASGVSEKRIQVLEPSALLDEKMHVFCPCANGGVLTERRARSMDLWAVCGGGNNLLANMKVADILEERGILHVPDILSSSGGVIHGIGKDLMKLDDRTPLIDAIQQKTLRIFEGARSRKSNTLVEARRLVQERISQHKKTIKHMP